MWHDDWLPPSAAEGAANVMQTARPKEPQPIKWIDAVAPNHSARNERWRRGVGPAVIANFAAPGERALDQVAIVSWNVHVGSGDIHVFLQHLTDGQLTGGEPVREYVLLVQETFRSGSAVPNPMPLDAKSARPICIPIVRGSATTPSLSREVRGCSSHMRHRCETGRSRIHAPNSVRIEGTQFFRRCPSKTSRRSNCRSSISAESRYLVISGATQRRACRGSPTGLNPFRSEGDAVGTICAGARCGEGCECT